MGFGIESQIREIECLSALEYLGLGFPKAIRSMPDLLVTAREQTSKHLVEAKYRNGRSRQPMLDIREQVRLFTEIVLIYLNCSPDIPGERSPSPSSDLRCCRLRHRENLYEAEIRKGDDLRWIAVDQLGEHVGQWRGLRPLQDVFDRIVERREQQTLVSAINAIRGIVGA